ncbi:MAG: tetratricopeptide repeat protein [Thermoanaerobaculia bacterium]
MRSARFTLVSLALCSQLLVAVSASAQPASPQDLVGEALALLRAGKAAEARTVLEQVLEIDPDNGAAHLQLGRLALERGDLEEAEAHLEVAADSQVPRAFMAWNLLGRVELLTNRPAAARTSFNHAVEKAPRFAPALEGRAKASLFLDEVEPALVDLQTAVALPGALGDADLLLGEVLVLLERDGEARTVLQAVSSSEEAGEEAATAAALILLAIDEQKTTRQEAELNSAVGRHPELPHAYLALGVHHLRQGERVGAEAPLRVAVDMDDRDPVPGLLLAQALGEGAETIWPEAFPELGRRFLRASRTLGWGEIETATRLAAEIVARRPYHVPARLVLIEAAEQSDDYWTALAGYEQLMEWLPGVGLLQARAAQTAHAMGADDLATCLARRALSSMPEDGSLHHLLAAGLAGSGQTEVAIDACRQAIELGVRESSVYQLLGDLHFGRLEVAEAIAAYSQALELDPSAAETLASFVVSSLTTDDYKALKDLLERHVEAHPENVNTLYSLGVMSLRDNELDSAARYFERLVEVAPTHTQVYYNLGQIYLRAGRQEEGQAAMERFRELKEKEDAEWLVQNQSHALRIDARDAVAQGDPGKGVQTYAKLVEQGTATHEDYLEAGEACLSMGDAAAASAWFERLLEFSPYDHRALEGLATAARLQEKPEVAEETAHRLAALSWPCLEDGSQ